MKIATSLIALFFAMPLFAEEADYASLKSDWKKEHDEQVKLQKHKWLKKIDSEIEINKEKKVEIIKELKSLQSTVNKKKSQIAIDKQKAFAKNEEMKSLETKIQQLEKSKEKPPRFQYGLNPAEMKEGDFGLLGYWERIRDRTFMITPTFRVLQIVDGNNAIMSLNNKSYWVEVETKGMTDRSAFVFDQFAHCLGTKSYTGIDGAKATVSHLRLVK